jgi:hypothetical protein
VQLIATLVPALTPDTMGSELPLNVHAGVVADAADAVSTVPAMTHERTTATDANLTVH